MIDKELLLSREVSKYGTLGCVGEEEIDGFFYELSVEGLFNIDNYSHKHYQNTKKHWKRRRRDWRKDRKERGLSLEKSHNTESWDINEICFWNLLHTLHMTIGVLFSVERRNEERKIMKGTK